MTTVLRVKRPRSQVPLEVLRLETSTSSSTSKRSRLDDDPDMMALSNLMHTNTYIAQKQDDHKKVERLPQSQPCSETVVFKRQCEDYALKVGGSNADDSRMLVKRLRDIVSGTNDIVKVVDCASFHDHTSCNSETFQSGRQIKKARLRMLGTQDVSLETPNNKSNSKKETKTSPKKTTILDPLTRKVDECLIACHEAYSVKAFIYLMNDGSIPVGLNSITSYTKLLNRSCTNGRGTALHLAALSNDRWGVEQLLCMGADPTLRDADDYVPAELAMMAGNNEIFEILNDAVKKIDDGEFVYDFYIVQTSNNSTGDRITHGKDKDENNSTEDGMALVEFEGGTGYWKNGVLVFEQEDAIDNIHNHGDLDHDSNDENFDGNDYPDDDDDDDSCYSSELNNHRMEPSVMYNKFKSGSQYEFEDDDEEYRGKFGVVSSESRFRDHHEYAYDSEFDGDEDDSNIDWVDRHCEYD